MTILAAQLRAAEAARTYISARNNEKHFTRTTHVPHTNTPTIRALAKKENISTGALQRAVKQLQNGTPYISILPKKAGRPRIISDAEDAALIAFVTWMERSGFPAEKSHIEQAVSKMWYSRWRDRHPELKRSYIKAINKARASFESADLEDITTFFDDLQHAIITFNISASECWNKDKYGTRIGCLRERIEVLITRTTRAARP
ncbi:Fc.00g082060.m01.CDS01 [Cosmosporella sp. VM-42]